MTSKIEKIFWDSQGWKYWTNKMGERENIRKLSTYPFYYTFYDSHLHHLHNMKFLSFAVQHGRHPFVL